MLPAYIYYWYNLTINKTKKVFIVEICNTYYLSTSHLSLHDSKNLLKKFFRFQPGLTVYDTLKIEIDELEKWEEFKIASDEKEFKGFFKLYRGNYNKNQEVGIYLEVKVECENEKFAAAKALSDKLIKLYNYKKRDFYLTVIDDQVSNYFRSLAYEHVARYELMLRELLLVVLLPSNGKDWVDVVSHLNKGLKHDDKDSIERGLEKLGLTQLEVLFFGDDITINSELYKKKFDFENLNTLSEDELKKIIRSNQPLSIWDKYIGDYVKIENLHTKMKNIKGVRNKVAHFKYFSYRDYNKFLKDVNAFTDKIDMAIEEIKSADSQIDVANLLRSVSSSIELLQSALRDNPEKYEILKEAISGVTSAIQGVSKTVNKSNN